MKMGNSTVRSTSMSREELEARFKCLVVDGKQVESTSSKIDISQKPDYFDEIRFKKSQATLDNYYAHISTASMTGLILLVQLEPILVPLLKTGKSRTVPLLFDRYVATVRYMRKLYKTDFYSPTSEGWKYIQIVRKMHQHVFKYMNADLESENKMEPPNVWVNQYDMALTQFAFIGLFLVKPAKCAAYYVTEEEIADIIYYWRVISYYLGIEERFNLFVYHDEINKQLEFLEMIFEHLKELLKAPRIDVGREMGKGILLALEDLATSLSFNILDHWWSPVISISGQENLSPYTLSDRCKLIRFLITFEGLVRVPTLRKLINELYKRKFDKFYEKKDEFRKKIEKKYTFTYE